MTEKEYLRDQMISFLNNQYDKLVDHDENKTKKEWINEQLVLWEKSNLDFIDDKHKYEPSEEEMKEIQDADIKNKDNNINENIINESKEILKSWEKDSQQYTFYYENGFYYFTSKINSIKIEEKAFERFISILPHVGFKNIKQGSYMYGPDSISF